MSEKEKKGGGGNRRPKSHKSSQNQQPKVVYVPVPVPQDGGQPGISNQGMQQAPGFMGQGNPQLTAGPGYPQYPQAPGYVNQGNQQYPQATGPGFVNPRNQYPQGRIGNNEPSLLGMPPNMHSQFPQQPPRQQHPPNYPPPARNPPPLMGLQQGNICQPQSIVPNIIFTGGQSVSQGHLGQAKRSEKHPVSQLNDLKAGHVTYRENPTGSDLKCMVAVVDGREFEGYATNVKEAKAEAAKVALKDLFNIVCIATGPEQSENSKKKEEKSGKEQTGEANKKKKNQKQNSDDTPDNHNQIMEDLLNNMKKLTSSDVNLKQLTDSQNRGQGHRGQRGNRRGQHGSQPNLTKNSDMRASVDNLKASTENISTYNRGRGRGHGNRGRGRGQSHNQGETRQNDSEDDSDKSDECNEDVQSNRGRHRGRRGGRNRQKKDKTEEDNSDNDSICSNDSQTGRGRGNRGGRGGRGRGGQYGSNLNLDKPVIMEEEDDDFSEGKVFKTLVQEFEGCVSLEKFKAECKYIPPDLEVDDWFSKSRQRFVLFKKGDKIIHISPFLKDATTCIDHMGFGSSKQCGRKDCKHFHICKHFLNGFCKRGRNCRKGHTFTQGHNRQIKIDLGLNPFRDKEICTIIQFRYPQVCSKRGCKNENCPFLHICFNFIRDKCDQDSGCTRGHSFDTPHNNWVLRAYKMEKWQHEKLALLKFLLNMPRQRRQRKSSEASSTVDVEDELSDEELSCSDEEEEEEEEVEEEVEVEEQVPVEPTRPSRRDRFKNYEDVADTEFLKGVEGGTVPSVTTDEKSGARAKTPKKPKEKVTSGHTSEKLTSSDAEKFDICLSYLSGLCKDPKCTQHHTSLPYQWQIKMYGEWTSFDNNCNQTTEQAFCQLQNVVDIELSYDDRQYKIHVYFYNGFFGVIYEVDGEPIANNEQFSIRRLSTPSYAKEKKPLSEGSFHTQWRWYFKDDQNKWQMYEKDTLQFTLEKKYTYGQKTYLFTRESYRFKYKINFTQMKQFNLDTGKVRDVCRHPTYVSLTDVNSKQFPHCLVITSKIPPKPPSWVPWDIAHDFELVELDVDSKEYIDVKESFFSTLKPEIFDIESVYRVQNTVLWNGYKTKKSNMEHEHEKQGKANAVDERNLFHGTDSINTCYGICTNNFDFRLSGKNATMYGNGSYFATTSKYSNSYTKGPMRLIFRAKVLIGNYTQGQKGITCPPNIPGEGHKRYDSCVNDMQNPSIFITFDLNQCYPEFLVAYREKDDGSSLNLSGDVWHPPSQIASANSAIGYQAAPQLQSQIYQNPYISQTPSQSPYTSQGQIGHPAVTVQKPVSSATYRSSSGRVTNIHEKPKSKDESCVLQ